MAHLFVIRSCPSFVQAPGATYGQHELIEEAINKREYEFNPLRKGYNIPHSSEWHFMEYRLKEEVIPQFVAELGHVINLAPIKPPSLWSLFRKPKDAPHKVASVGPAIMYARYMMKLLRKALGNKLRPVDVPEGHKSQLVEGWAYHIILGWVPDINKGQGEEL